jgi:hypothetical protein
MENLDQESKSQSQPEIFIFSEPRFPTGWVCLEEGKFTELQKHWIPYSFETLRIFEITHTIYYLIQFTIKLIQKINIYKNK